jgi:hypothetical protein
MRSSIVSPYPLERPSACAFEHRGLLVCGVSRLRPDNCLCLATPSRALAARGRSRMRRVMTIPALAIARSTVWIKSNTLMARRMVTVTDPSLEVCEPSERDHLWLTGGRQ